MAESSVISCPILTVIQRPQKLSNTITPEGTLFPSESSGKTFSIQGKIARALRMRTCLSKDAGFQGGWDMCMRVAVYQDGGIVAQPQ